ncbi:hypothetical protein [Vulgatibacter sp.]|uniref:hypothetical protein n=1 Tax=Vulgatibacter sp. TaxID=1971226 RepID=UPI0035689291
MVMKLPLLALLLASSLDPALLAPGPQELRAQVATLRRHLGEADAIGRAEARIHNQLAQGPVAEGSAALCASEESRSLLARSTAFGSAYRDRVQTVRADAVRLRRLVAEPTLQPILRREQREQADALLARVDDHVRRYREMAAWQARFLQPAIQRCKPALAAAPGIPGERGEGTAVIGIGGGKVCPGGVPADGTVVVLPEPRACYGERDCSCAPMPVTAGAVLGP